MKHKKHYAWRKNFAIIMVAIMLLSTCFGLVDNYVYAAESVGVLDDYDSATDIAKKVLPSGEYAAEQNIRNELYFKAISFKENSYNMTVNAKYNDNPDAVDEGVRFIVAKATDRYYGNTVTIEVNVRGEHVHIFARRADGTSEELLKDGWHLSNGTKGKDNAYAIRYDDGKIWFYENGKAIHEAVSIGASRRYLHAEPYIGFAFETAGGRFHNFKLWGSGVSFHGEFPSMPSGNGDYADYIGIKAIQGTSTKYENGVLYNTNNCTDLITFTKLPFVNKDTFAWSFDVNVKEATKPYYGVRAILRADEDFVNTYQLAMVEKDIVVMYNNEEVAKASYNRTLGKTDKIGIVSKPNSVSIWVNDILTLENVPLEHDLELNVGIKYEYTNATIRNMHFYYTEKTPFVAPEADPTIPVMTSDMYNAAQYMVVKNGNEEYPYQNYQIKHYAASENGKYVFENIPLPEEAAYTYRADVVMRTEFSEPWRGPRMLFRTGEQGDIYLAFCKETVLIICGDSLELESYPMNVEVGKTYDVAIYSNTDYVNVWVDGKLIFNKVPLSENGEKTKAKAGVLFELCDATLSNIKIYGKSVVFSEDIFDVDLKNNKWFNATTVPEMPSGNQNYFTNVKLGGETTLGYAQAYADGIFHSPVSGTTVQGDFVDQEDSHCLNGLKKSETYVWSSKVRINKVDWVVTQLEGEERQDAGVTFVFKDSEHPSNDNQGYKMCFCMVQNRLELQIWQNDSMIKAYYNEEFKFVDGKEYDVSLLIGETWAKVWVNNELIFTAHNLPAYHLKFMLAVTNVDADIYDNVVYQVEKDDATILDVKASAQATRAGNTLYGVPAEDIPLIAINWQMVMLITVISLLVMVVAIFLLYKGKQCYIKVQSHKKLLHKKQTAEIEGEQDS